MLDLLESGMFKDLAVNVEGKKLMLHKAIVSARSEYFDIILKSSFKENSDSAIEIKECSFEVFKQLCEHIYSDKVAIDYANIYNLLVVADRFRVPHLKGRLESAMVDYISTENAAKVYKYANRNNYDRLRNICTSYILEHYVQVVQTNEFYELDKDEIVRLVRLHDAG
eukprot:TRINITY_DN3468_c0_g4_i1.p1 TRINITY_DN3468_c0_g4~~TRINITY_DN3468_c0_g4_i1.p1  ORF type:complete len:168 (+),score=50.13 TRINITY_DN3468_c0_g4_i1:292-795(+)